MSARSPGPCEQAKAKRPARLGAQAVALVFDHISLAPEEVHGGAGRGGAPSPESPRDGPEGFPSGSANAALKLLDDLCLMAGGALPMGARAVLPFL